MQNFYRKRGPVALRSPVERRRYTSPLAFSLGDIKAGASVRAAFVAAASLSRDGEEVK
jgi:hypothetical protein